MVIYLAADHAGFELKEKIKDYLSKDHDLRDEGALSFDKDDDYPILISKAAEKVSQNPNSRAIIFGKSGNGEEIVANKFENVRAIEGFSKENVRLAREDNDANVLSLGSAFVDFEKARQLVEVFLNTPFSNEERHERRIKEIEDIEKSV